MQALPNQRGSDALVAVFPVDAGQEETPDSRGEFQPPPPGHPNDFSIFLDGHDEPGGMIVMSLAGGAVFGLVWGTVLVSFVSAIGSTLAFLAARYTLRDVVRRRLGSRLRMIDAGMEASGSFYLFGVWFVPVIPYFLVNL